jgi:predicted AAA+ superfamily ATPase
MAYQHRVIDDQLDALLPMMPAILLDGPKGVGKTATALQRASTTFRLDDPTRLQIVQASPELAMQQPGPVLFDEWQRMPAIWDAVKRAVDSQTGQEGPFLLTGSAYVPGVTTHSGAGRIHDLRMRPMTLPERGVTTPAISLRSLLAGGCEIPLANTTFNLQDYVDEIVASGFPGIRRLKKEARQAQLDSYLTNIVYKDIREAGQHSRRPEAVMAWLRGYAAATSTAATWEKVRNAATPGDAHKPARKTIQPYIEVLQMLRILDEVPAWLPSNNYLNRLMQAPKHHLADPALAARLLGVTSEKLMAGEEGTVSIPRNGTLLGALFESLVTLSVRVFAQPLDAVVSHLRTADTRHEVDLIVESQHGNILGIEVKLSAEVDSHDVRHLLWLKGVAPERVVDLVMVTTGGTAFRRSDGVAVIPLALLGP